MTSPEAPAEPVEIVPYDPLWPMRFHDEAEILRQALAPWLAGAIEHIGSTAIPGLAAKPVVDIMVGVATLDGSRPAVAAATALGYCYAPYRADIEHWFCKPSPALRTHHLHLIPVGTSQWLRPIAFREYPACSFRCCARIRGAEAEAGRRASHGSRGLHAGEAPVHRHSYDCRVGAGLRDKEMNARKRFRRAGWRSPKS